MIAIRPDNKMILDELNDLLKNKYKDEFKSVYLFGSQINGMMLPDSDFDILILMNCAVDWRVEREISDLCYLIDLKYSILTDIHVLNSNELNTVRGKQPIFTHAIEQGIHV